VGNVLQLSYKRQWSLYFIILIFRYSIIINTLPLLLDSRRASDFCKCILANLCGILARATVLSPCKKQSLQPRPLPISGCAIYPASGKRKSEGKAVSVKLAGIIIAIVTHMAPARQWLWYCHNEQLHTAKGRFPPGSKHQAA
jgi:hypothetical protein